jgi:hypothetical protein
MAPGFCYRHVAPTELGVPCGQPVIQTFRSYGAEYQLRRSGMSVDRNVARSPQPL